MFDDGKLNNVGLLMEGTIHDETWGSGAYSGLLNIKEDKNVSVLLRENIATLKTAEKAVKDLERQGVNLVFGHGSNYGRIFDSLNEYYPEIHFVYFNGQTFDHNITSIHFDGYDMGYFAGRLAGEMTSTKHIGIIRAFKMQEEAEGFYEGVLAVDPTIKVSVRSVNSWYDQQKAMLHFQQLTEQGIDVVYPAGDGFNVPVIKAAEAEDIFAVGYIQDQHHISESTVLTSTVQQLDGLYLKVADMYDQQQLTPGIINFPFDQSFVTLGTYSNEVPEGLQSKLNNEMDSYIESGVLPR